MVQYFHSSFHAWCQPTSDSLESGWLLNTYITGSLWNRRGELVTNNTDKFSTFFSPPSHQHCWTSGFGNNNPGWCKHKPTAVGGGRVGVWTASGAWPHRLLGLDNIHLRVLRDLDGFIVSLLSLIFEKSWRSGDIREGYEKAEVTCIYKKGSRKDPGVYRSISDTSPLGRVTRGILLGAITR